MRPNWRRCDAQTRRGEPCMRKAQFRIGAQLLCSQHFKLASR